MIIDTEFGAVHVDLTWDERAGGAAAAWGGQRGEHAALTVDGEEVHALGIVVDHVTENRRTGQWAPGPGARTHGRPGDDANPGKLRRIAVAVAEALNAKHPIGSEATETGRRAVERIQAARERDKMDQCDVQKAAYRERAEYFERPTPEPPDGGPPDGSPQLAARRA